MKFILAGVFLLFISTYCFGQQQEVIRVLYQETVCEPEWNDVQNPQNTFENLQRLFRKDSVQILGIRWTGKPYDQTCAGCGCLTGRNIEIKIYRKDLAKAEAMNFWLPWIWMGKDERVCDWSDALDDMQIQQKLLEKNIHARLVAITGPSEKAPSDCGKSSGRHLTVKVAEEDSLRAKKEGFVLLPSFKEY